MDKMHQFDIEWTVYKQLIFPLNQLMDTVQNNAVQPLHFPGGLKNVILDKVQFLDNW